MNQIARQSWIVLGILLLLAAAALNPAPIVHHFLPKTLSRYELSLLRGLQLTRGMLLLDGFLCLIAPLLARWSQPPANPRLLETHGDPLSPAELCGIAGATLLGAGLRLYHLGVGFSYDETVISMSMMEKSVPYLFARAEFWRTFYALCGHVLYALFGRHEWVAHLPSFLCGVATIPALYLLVRNYLGKQEAFWSAVFLAVSGFHIWYSQIATSYCMSLFFSLCSMLLLRHCLSTARFRTWIAWGALVFLALYSHFFVASFAILGQALYLLCLLYTGQITWLPVKQFLIALAFSGAVFLTLAAPNLPESMNILSGLGGSEDAHFVDAEPRGTVIGQLHLFAQWLFQPYAPSWLQWYGVAIAAIGLVILCRRSTLLAIYLCLPTVILWSIFASGIMRRITPRHSIFTLIPMCVLLSLCATVATESLLAIKNNRFLRAAIPILIAAPLLAAAGISLSDYYSRERSVFRPTSLFLASHIPSADNVYIVDFGYDAFHYYFPALQKIQSDDQFRDLLDSPKPFWLIAYSQGFPQELPPSLKAAMNSRGTLRFDCLAFPEQYADLHESHVWYVQPSTLAPSAARIRSETHNAVAVPAGR